MSTRIPILHLKKPDRSRWDDRKLDHVRPYLERAERQTGGSGWWPSSPPRSSSGCSVPPTGPSKPGVVNFDFAKPERRVGIYYFYVLDREFGPGFIKICTYFPYPAKVWLNGHEWAKRQADRAGLAFTALANGFASCADPDGCRRSATGSARPTCRGSSTGGSPRSRPRSPPTDRTAGYWWELSMRQVEVSPHPGLR